MGTRHRLHSDVLMNYTRLEVFHWGLVAHGVDRDSRCVLGNKLKRSKVMREQKAFWSCGSNGGS